MKVVKGNKIIEIDRQALAQLAAQFEKVIIDLGTGDGRFVYKNALETAKTLFIGIDPAPKQMEEFSKKAVRKKLENILFVIGSVELLPIELEAIADELKIILPWGTLLKAVAEPTTETISKLDFLTKKHATIEMIFGYDSEIEPTETLRLGLNQISQQKIEEQILPEFEKAGYKKSEVKALNTSDLKDLESTWGKRISQREERNVFLVKMYK